MSLPGVEFGAPGALWVLLAALWVFVATWRSRAWVAPWALRAATWTRALCVALLALALADTRVTVPTRKLAVGVLLDGSASVTPGERARHGAALDALRGAHEEIAWATLPWASGPWRTDLAGALAAASGLLPSDRARRVVLVTDGRATAGNTALAVRSLVREGITLDVLPAGDRPLPDGAAVTSVELPRLVRAGQPVTVTARLWSAEEQPAGLTVLRDGVPVLELAVTLTPGENLHPLEVPFPDEGVHVVTVQVMPSRDRVPENNNWRSLVRVLPPPRVLLVHEGATEPLLASVLRDGRLLPEVVRAPAVPTALDALERYQLVVLDELSLDTLTQPQRQALRAWVELRGGGLITATGGHAVTGQPDDLRALEPIRPPRAVPDPRPLEIIFVIDRSSSMSGGRIASARGGAMAAIQQLREDARAGVVSFSDGVDGTMGLVSMDARATLIAFTMHLRAGGGTDLSSGLRGARRMLSGDPRYLHHVVLLSDGESDPGPALAAAQSVASAGATLSAITIGPYSELMASIARIGRGRYHVTSNAGSLPALMVREAQYRQPPPSYQGSFTPTVARRMAFVEGLDLAHDPPLTGHVLCETRSGADTVLTATGESPLLAHWYVGAGQVATWTSSVEGRWTDAFRGASDFRTLWTRLAWDLLRQRTEDPVTLVLDRSPERPDRVAITAVTARAAQESPPPVALSLGGPATPLALRPVGPGVFTTEVPMAEALLVEATDPRTGDVSAAAGLDATNPEELRTFGADPGALQALALAGHGRVLRHPEEALRVPEPVRVPYPVRLPAMALAVFLYLLGVLFLRLPGARR